MDKPIYLLFGFEDEYPLGGFGDLEAQFSSLDELMNRDVDYSHSHYQLVNMREDGHTELNLSIYSLMLSRQREHGRDHTMNNQMEIVKWVKEWVQKWEMEGGS